MFSQKLESLIQTALKDGVLTEQEKEVIMKRALAEGEDKDEVEIYIQSLIKEREQGLGEDSGKLNNMISRISEASTHMKVEAGVIVFESSYKYVTKEYYDALRSEGKGEFLSYYEDEDNGTCTYCYWPKYDYYFPLLRELDCLYGDIPKVRMYITEQKKRELEILSSAFLNEIESYKSASSSMCKVEKISNAEKCLYTIKNTYGSLPGAQSLISEYQNKIDKIKSSLRYKFANITKGL